MKIILTCILIIFTGSVFSQTPDTLVRLGGRKIPVYVNKIGPTDVYFSPIAKPKTVLSVERKNLEKIIFKSGRIEQFNNEAFKIIEEGQWEAVIVTKKKKDIEGLYKRKVITAETLPSSKARNNNLIKMKKQAANAGGTYVLITKEESQGSFGELPGSYMEGIAYGPEPLEEGTDVATKHDDKR